MVSDDMKMYGFVVFTLIVAVATAYTIFAVVIPKELIIDSRLSSRVMQWKIDVNDCVSSGGVVFIDEKDKVFCGYAKEKYKNE